MAQTASTPPPYPPERTLKWTRRQRQVLELIARGKSNPEIAGALGLSLEGAKWHVREIMSKLNIDSREEAAEYWRWRQGLPQRLKRALGAIPALGPFKLAGGASAMVLVGAVVVAIALGMSGDDDEEELVGYYLEYSEVYPGGEDTATYRWWVVDDVRWRLEIIYETDTQYLHSINGANGHETWLYDVEENEIQVYAPDDPADRRALHVPLRDEVNPSLRPGPASQEAIDILSGRVGSDTTVIIGVEHDRLLDHPVTLITASAPAADPGGEWQVWVDLERGVVLGSVRTHPDDADWLLIASTYEAEVRLSSSFFDPPDGGEAGPPRHICPEGGGYQVELGTSATLTDERRAEFQADIAGAVPPGMLQFVPLDGWWIVAAGAAAQCSVPRSLLLPHSLEERFAFPVNSYRLQVVDASTLEVNLEQRRVTVVQSPGSEVPVHLRLPLELTVEGHSGYAGEDGEQAFLRWSDGKRVIEMTGRHVGLEELLELARQLREPQR